MSLLKEPYDPEWYRIRERDKGYATRYKEYLIIQIDQSRVSSGKVIPPILFVAGTVGLGIIFNPLFLLLNILIPMIWMVAPQLRPIQQLTKMYLMQEGLWQWAEREAPPINWQKFDTNELYRSAVKDWMEAVRHSGDVSVNKKDWKKYISEMESLALKDVALNPDFETLKALKEVMGK